MPATKNNPLLSELKKAFPDLTFKASTRFSYKPPRTICYNLNDPDFPLLILHELGHATLGRDNFKTDIERLKIETAAWDAARGLSERFGVKFDPDFAENELDSYRDWLHTRSKCKICGLTRYQTRDGHYHCPGCG